MRTTLDRTTAEILARNLSVLAGFRADLLRFLLRIGRAGTSSVREIGSAVDSTGLLDWVKVACPDLILLDWELPGLPGGALLQLLHDFCPRLQVIALSGRPEARQAALDAGADAFASKGEPPERLLAVVNTCCHT